MHALGLGRGSASPRFEGFLGEMTATRPLRILSALALTTFVGLEIAPIYFLTYGLLHLVCWGVLFSICDRARAATEAGSKQRYLNAAIVLRSLMVLHTCWLGLDIRFAHHLRAESTLLLTGSLVLAAMQTQPGRISYLLGLAPPLGAMLLLIALRPMSEMRTGLATLLLLVTVLITAVRQQKISRRALVLQLESDASARALADSLAAAELADEVASLGHWRVGPAGEHTWSAGVFRIFGLPVADEPPPIPVAIGFYREEDRAEVADAVANAMSSRCGFTFEHQITRADGAERLLVVKCRFQETEGGGWLLGVVQDITEQRAAERQREESDARYKLLADNAGDMIVQTKLSGRITYISPACLAVTGYTPQELVGLKITDFILEEDAPLAAGKLVEALSAASPTPWRLDYRVRRKDGEVIWLECHPRISFDEAGRPLGIIDVVRDASARKALERDLVAAREAAEVGAQTKTDFLANMSHELRTPLNSIVGFSSLIAEAPELEGETRRRARMVHEASRSLVTIVNDVLEVSRIEAEGITLRPEPADLGHLIQSVADLVRQEAEAKGLDLVVRLPTMPIRVLVDAVRLRQVLMNLIGNAVKFTEHGAVSVSLSRDMQGRLRFSVKDSGVGIPLERQAAIFQRFAQADGSTARRFGGSGLGLTICRSILDAMGGEIGVHSVERAGSTFWFVIDPPDAPKVIADPQSAAVEAADLRGVRLLLADDNPMNRDLFAALLEPTGVEITCAEDGAEALAAVQNQPFDIVFMDVQMPVMDGFETTRAIRALGLNRLPIIALTANVLQAQVDQCLAAGMSAHLGKPFRLKDVLTTLAQWVERAPAAEGVVQTEVMESIARAIGPEKLAHFLTGLADQLREMVDIMARATPDTAEIAHQAHQLCGYAASLGYVELGDRYRELERACRQNEGLSQALMAARHVTSAALQDLNKRKAA